MAGYDGSKLENENEVTTWTTADWMDITSDSTGETSKIAPQNLFDGISGFITPNYAGELTINAGVVTATGSFHLLDTESDDATDNLDTINGYATGRILIIRPIVGTRTIVVKHGTGNLTLQGSADFTMDHQHDIIVLFGIASGWIEICRSNNGV